MPDQDGPQQRPLRIDESASGIPLDTLTGRRGSGRQRANIVSLHEQAGRVPPQAVDVEQSVLGAMLIEREAIPKAIEILPADAFYDARHSRIYGAMLGLFERGNPVDLITLTEELKRRGEFEPIGGYYLSELTTRVASAANVEYHARIIAEKSLLRQMIETMTTTVGEAYDPGTDAFDLLDRAERDIFQISETQLRKSSRSMSEVVMETFKQLEALSHRDGGITGVPSGFHALDNLTGGWQKSDLIIIAARPSMGKAQPLDAPLLTPEGWKTMGEIKPGHTVVGSDGQPKRVLGVFPQGVTQTYRVGFADGTSVECCGEHLWYTTSRTERKRNRGGAVRTTTEIARTLTVEEQGHERWNHHIPHAAPVEHAEQDFIVDPYALGALLGDGGLTNSTVRFSTADPFMLEQLEARLPEVTLQLAGGYDYRLSTARGAPNPLKAEIQALGLDGCRSEHKFIPPRYLRGSAAQRLALLRGLMDTDGTHANGGTGVRFTTTSPRLRDDVLALVRSLGGRASWTTRTTGYTHRGEKRLGQPSHRVYATFPGGLCPFLLPRKASGFVGLKRITDKAIVAVEPVRQAECQCILIDSEDHLYIAEGYNLTHNTAFALATMMNAATHPEYQVPVAIFSLEMSANQLAQRMLTSEARIDAQKARTGRLHDEDWPKLARAAGRLEAAKIFVDDTPGLGILELRAKCRRLKAEHDIGLVIVDYLQLMHGTKDSRNSNREQEIAQISRSLKALAKELDVPVIALAQLSRAVETRGGDKRPQLSDLRESGSIEQDADVVAFIYRAERYGITQDEHGNSTAGLGELIIGKQRNGPIGNVRLAFVNQYARFENLTTYYGSDPGYAFGAGGAAPPPLPSAGGPAGGYDDYEEIPPPGDAPF